MPERFTRPAAVRVEIGPTCCVACRHAWADTAPDPTTRIHRTSIMIVCVDCGNKRCPKATDHDLDCTGSNEPGQPGSKYGPSA